MSQTTQTQVETKSEAKPRRSYWRRGERGMIDEFIGIATTREDAEQYKAEGYERIDRDEALRCLSIPSADSALHVTIDGEPDQEGRDRLQIARAFRKGKR